MSVSIIDVTLFKRMVINGAVNLKNNREEVDQLNVFPVPDGDTGTNMSMTVTSGVNELEACESSSIIDNAKVLSRGALMGARGNSGVILSQFFRGFFVGLKEIQQNYLTKEDLLNCLDSGCKIAYKAVMEPVEGTILTVIREGLEAIKDNEYESIDSMMDSYLLGCQTALQNTPNLLPVLKEAGVVDSGGAGFTKIIEGMVLALKGEILEANDNKAKTEAQQQEIKIKFLYSIDFILELKKPDQFVEKELKAALSLLGDSLSVVREDNKVKAHINTNRPGRALEISQKQGEFISLTIDNRKIQVQNNSSQAKENILENKAPKKHFALITVCFGDGIVNTFKELGVDYVIEGGQTMNPSTEAFVEAIKAVNAANVIIIPNNSNVIMAAKQAASMVSDVNVEVIRAKTIAQGYTSLIAYDPEASIEHNVEAMSEQIANVTSGEITYSIRDTEIGGVKIKSGDYMGICNGEIIVSTKEKKDALVNLLKQIIKDDSEIITLFCGVDANIDSDEIENICLEINPNIEVQVIEGKQEIYSFIIAVE